MPPNQATLESFRQALIQAKPGGIAPQNLLNEMSLRPEGEVSGPDVLNQIRRALTNFRAAPAGLSGMAKKTGLDLLNLIQKGRTATRPEDISPAEALSVPLVGGAASIATGVPRGVGIFGGRLASEFPARKAAEFDRLREMGASPQDAFRQTGFFKGADGKLRFEIPDQSARFKPEAEPIFKRFAKAIGFSRAEKGREHTLGSILDHPQLFKAYPQLKDTKVVVDTTNSNLLGQFDPVKNQILINPMRIRQDRPDLPLDQSIKSTTLHEVQHAVQEIETFAKGGNTDYMREILKVKGAKDLAESDEATFSAYKQLAGETEARLVQRRMFMENQQRRSTAPFTQEDLPRRQQLVRRGTETTMPIGVEP